MKNLHLLSDIEFESYLDTLKGNNKRKAKAKRDFMQQLNDAEYKLLGEYIDSTTKVLVKCNNPSHEPYSVRPNMFKIGTRCPNCTGNTPIQAKRDFMQQLNDAEYKLLGEYVNASTKVLVKCNNPSHEPYSVRPNMFKIGKRCPACAGTCQIQAKRDFMQQLNDAEYKLLGKYVNASTKVLVKCNNPSHEPYSVRPSMFKKGTRCPACSLGSFDPSKQGTLYITLLEDQTYTCVKIGITNRDTYTRYVAKDRGKIQRAWEFTLEDGHKIKELEDELHALFDAKRKDCGEWLHGKGNTELFEASILHDALSKLDFNEVTK